MKKEINQKIEKLVKEASFRLRPDVKKTIFSAFKKEKKKMPKQALGWILDNAEIAKAEKTALCQDTGLPIVFFEIGYDIKVNSTLINEIKNEISRCYEKFCLRRSIVDPLQRKKPRYQGVLEHIYFSSSQKGLRITLFPKGFGSENKAQLKMFNPTAKINEIEEFVLNCVQEAGPESCPPFFIGIGIGGTSDHALLLAKKALIDRIDLPNPDQKLKSIEKRIFTKINSLGIGPMGFGGRFTALAVKIKKDQTHIAGLPVGVNVSCHALRSATVKISV
ncbi:MAG: fumarate hydratase [Candidatus Omnitrophica bacterium]|nr:fumarate hydratase [Candidatus Omnitrophota bacterium]